jgi:hypothetical protein
LVSRITGPTRAPIAFGLPPLMRSTTSGFSAITLATMSASSSPASIAARPSRSTIACGSPPSATSVSSTWRPAPALIVRACTNHTSFASASGVTLDSRGSVSAPMRARRSVTQLASARGSAPSPPTAASKNSP